MCVYSIYLLEVHRSNINSDYVWYSELRGNFQFLYFNNHGLTELKENTQNNLCNMSISVQGTSRQFSSVAQSCPTLCDPMNHSTPGLPVHHQLPEFTQTHVHRVSDAIQPSHPLPSPFPPAPNPSQHQSLFQWVNSSLEVAIVLEFHSFQRTPRADLL